MDSSDTILSAQPHNGFFVEVFSDITCCLIYFLNVYPQVDPKIIEVTLDHYPQLKDITMTLEQMLIKRSKAEGKANGVWIGKLQLLQNLMIQAVTATEALEQLTVQELEARFNELQGAYDKRFKR